MALYKEAARLKTNARKEDTRQKIRLGGLIKKAGLADETTAIIYGALLEIAEKLSTPQAENHRQEWRIKGNIALTSEGMK